MSDIRKVQVGGTAYDIAASYLLDANGNLKDYASILTLINNARLKIQVCNAPDNTPKDVIFTPKGGSTTITGTLTAAAADTQTFYFVYDGDGTNDSYMEYVTNGTMWEVLGKADVDLSGYVQKNVIYANAAQSAGAHTHTVTVPTVSVDKTHKLGATASGTGVSTTKDKFVKSYPGATSKLVTTTVKGVNGTTTASKATAGTAFNAVKSVGIASESASAAGRVAYISEVAAPSLGGTTSFNTDAIKNVKLSSSATNTTGSVKYSEGISGSAPALTGTTTFATGGMTASVSGGVLSFTAAGTGTVGISGGSYSSTTKYLTGSGDAATKSSVTISGGGGTTKYLSVSATTQSVTPYSFADVTVPVAATDATTVATGALNANGAGASVMTGLGTATTADAVTGVTVTDPTITITENAADGPVNEHVTTSTATATTSSDGAHTHDVKVTS